MDVKEFSQRFRYIWRNETNSHYQLLQQDSLFFKIAPEELEHLIEKAEWVGKQEALAFRENLEKLENLLSTLTIAGLSEAKCGQLFYRFAEFKEPDQIFLDHKLLEKAQDFMEKQNLIELIGSNNVRDIVLMHEVFHAIESQKKIWTTQKQLEYNVAFLKKTARIYALSEIAAFTFVQEYFQLENSPALLASCLIYPKNPTLAQKILASQS